MKSLIVTSAELSDEVVEELSTDRTVKTLHHPGAGFDLSPLADLAWPDELIVDESLIDLLPSGIGVPVRPLREVVPDAQLSAPAEIHDRPRGNILFVPCNDTHVRMFLPLARQLENRTFLVIRGENADHYLEEHDDPTEEEIPPPNMSESPPPLPLCMRMSSTWMSPVRTSSTCRPIRTASTKVLGVEG